jgi:hypothetical protein
MSCSGAGSSPTPTYLEKDEDEGSPGSPGDPETHLPVCEIVVGEGLISFPSANIKNETMATKVEADLKNIDLKIEALEPLDPDDQVESDLSDSSESDGEAVANNPNSAKRRRVSNIVEVNPQFHQDHFLKFEDGESGGGFEVEDGCVFETEFPGISCIEGRPRTYVCNHCSYTSNHSGHVKRHVMSVHDKVRFPCPSCEHQSTTIYHLKRHIAARHESTVPRLSCELCAYNCVKRDNLKKHIEKVHGLTLKPLNQKEMKLCDKCDFSTLDSAVLKAHKRSEHTAAPADHIPKGGVYTNDIESSVTIREDDGRYYCDMCDYQASLRGSVSRHIRTIHQGLRYPCDQCEYQATRSHHLKRHKERLHFVSVT